MKILNKKMFGIAMAVIALISLSGLAVAATTDQVGQTADQPSVGQAKDQSSVQQKINVPIDPNSYRRTKGGVKFYTDKSTYKFNAEILFTLENGGSKTIWVPNIFNSKWQIVNQKTHEIIYLPLEDCTDEYGNCGDPFTRLEFGEKITQSWDQFNNDDEHVPAGNYIASATYRLNNPTQPSQLSVFKVYTKTFKIKKP